MLVGFSLSTPLIFLGKKVQLILSISLSSALRSANIEKYSLVNFSKSLVSTIYLLISVLQSFQSHNYFFAGLFYLGVVISDT